MSRASQLQALAAQDPSNPMLLCDLLDGLLGEGRVDEAIAQLRATEDGLRVLPAVKFREARCALMVRDFTAAATLLQPLVDDMGDVPAGIAHDLAYAHFSLGHFDTALQVLANVRPQGGDATAVALLKARVLHHQCQYDTALDVLGAITHGERLAEVLGLRAMLLLDSGNTAEAATAAAQALVIDPAQCEAAIVAGTVALWEQRLDVSQAMFDQVLAIDPHSGRALLGIGQNCMLRADVAAARVALERATAAMPEHIGSWHALAWCQLLEGDLAGAERSFERSFAIDRTFGETHGGLALVHALRGECTAAEESIRRATRLDPQGSSARYARSVLLLDEGRPQEAQAIVDGILQSPGIGVSASADFIFRLRELVRPRG
ncbi:MAG: tetratricopeptide repeat protein [Rhodanobacter sp.]